MVFFIKTFTSTCTFGYCFCTSYSPIFKLYIRWHLNSLISWPTSFRKLVHNVWWSRTIFCSYILHFLNKVFQSYFWECQGFQTTRYYLDRGVAIVTTPVLMFYRCCNACTIVIWPNRNYSNTYATWTRSGRNVYWITRGSSDWYLWQRNVWICHVIYCFYLMCPLKCGPCPLLLDHLFHYLQSPNSV